MLHPYLTPLPKTPSRFQSDHPGNTGAGNNYSRFATTKTAVRDLAAPIADLASFIALIQGILDTNPWGCTSYQAAGQTLPALAKTVGQISVKAPKSAAFNTNVSTIVANAALSTAMGGTPSHDSSEDKFLFTLRCHDTNGELYIIVSMFTKCVEVG
jgi:hypothetical protein